MKASMDLPIQQYRRSIANHEDNLKKYTKSRGVQSELHCLSKSQNQKVPKKLCLLTYLYGYGIISNINLGKNTAEEMKVAPNQRESCSVLCTVQHALSDVYRAAKDSADNLFIYDPLTFPAADASSSLLSQRLSWLKPHSAAFVPKNPVFTQPDDQDDVKIEKIDFSCLEERAELSTSDVLRKIASTLKQPTTETTRESQILSYYAQHRPCPTQEGVEKVTKITAYIDQTISQIANLSPELTTIQIAQHILAPVLKMVADDMDDKKIEESDIQEVSDEILSFSKSVVDSILQDKSVSPTEERLKIPQGVTFVDDNFHVDIDGSQWSLTSNTQDFFASKNGATRAVKYHEKEGKWRFHETENRINTQESEDPFFTMCSIRPQRGISLGKLCSSPPNEPALAEHHPEPSHDTAAGRHRPLPSPTYSAKHNRLIENLRIGLDDTSGRVDKIKFADDWEMYRVREDDEIGSKYFHAVKMNGKLVPVRSTLIGENHIYCEAYYLNHRQPGFPVFFHEGAWWFEQATSIHVAHNLKENILPNMFARDIFEQQLSTPDKQGLKWDADGNAYLKINHRFAKVETPLDNPTIISETGEKFHLSYSDHKFHFTRALLHNEYLAVSEYQFRLDNHLNSVDGLDFYHPRTLNENWSLLNVNIKSNKLIERRAVGSKIDVKFVLRYLNNGDVFRELPPLQWREKIRFQEGEELWEFNSDMYEHNKNSLTFFPWNNKYLEAYHYSKSTSRDIFQSLVKIYKQDMQPLEARDLPIRFANEDKIEAVKSYLEDNGGFLEVTITDVPQIKIDNIDTNKQRVINFSIGFKDHNVATFNQAICIEDYLQRVFVTTSRDINLAQGELNAFPPPSVARKRRLKREELG